METGLVRASVLLRRSHPGGGGDQAQRGTVSHNPSRWRRGSESPPGEMLQHSLICPAGRGGNPPCLLFEVFRCCVELEKKKAPCSR